MFRGAEDQMLMLDPVFDAATAKELGIVHDVFDKDEFASKVHLDKPEPSPKLCRNTPAPTFIAKFVQNSNLKGLIRLSFQSTPPQMSKI